jgi:hypothetical protein
MLYMARLPFCVTLELQLGLQHEGVGHAAAGAMRTPPPPLFAALQLQIDDANRFTRLLCRTKFTQWTPLMTGLS